MQTFGWATTYAASMALLQGCGAATPPHATSTTDDSLMETTIVSTSSSNPVTKINTASAATPALTSQPADVAAWLNLLYKGFDAKDDESPLGVTISVQDEFVIYCSKLPGQDCYQGHADCRFSASLYNDQMMIDTKTGGLKMTMGQSSGIVFNQTLVESKIGKCSYIFDGGSFNRYNGACGCLALSASCEDPHSAFGDVCPSTGKTCTVSDREVEGCSCDSMGDSGNKVMGCFHKGAGYDRGSEHSSTDQTRSMVKARLRHQDGTATVYGQPVRLLEYWNEVVVDEVLMLKQLEEDPVPVIPAFVYVKGSWDGRSKAQKMRDTYRKQFAVKANIPLVAIDLSVRAEAAHGPFVLETDVEDSVLLV